LQGISFQTDSPLFLRQFILLLINVFPNTPFRLGLTGIMPFNSLLPVSWFWAGRPFPV
jgi:hypothetical protein